MSTTGRRLLDGLDTGEVALAALRALPAASVLVFDTELRYVIAAGEILAREGLAAEELEGRPAVEVLVGERWRTCEPLYRAALAGQTRAVEVWSEQETSCFEVTVGPLRAGDGTIVGGVAVSREITARRHTEEARRHAQERFELIFDHAPVGMALLTPDGRWVRVNHALVAITGYSAEELLAKTVEEVTHPDDLAADAPHIRQLLAGEISDYQIEKRYLHARGHVISTVLSVSLVRDRGGGPLHFIAQIQDVSERRLMEGRVRELADRDPLTGAHNRRRLERELAIQISRCHRDGDEAALIALDVEGFGQINETYGYRAGDELLKAIAEELARNLRGTDLVARTGDDEFAVILPGTAPQAAQRVAANLRDAAAGRSVVLDAQRLSAEVSVAAVAIDRSTPGAEAVLIDAARALRAAKGRAARSQPAEARARGVDEEETRG